MPKYIARLEAQDKSKNYRRVAITADSKQEAQAFLEDREATYALYRLDQNELAAAEKSEQDGRLAGSERSKLVLHRQEKPYVLVSIEEEKAAA